MGHYDARYFHGVVTDEERKTTQLHMIRSYLDFFREKGLDTWIAHGTLLGWWWNGKVIIRHHFAGPKLIICSDYLGTGIWTHRYRAPLFYA